MLVEEIKVYKLTLKRLFIDQKDVQMRNTIGMMLNRDVIVTESTIELGFDVGSRILRTTFKALKNQVLKLHKLVSRGVLVLLEVRYHDPPVG